MTKLPRHPLVLAVKPIVEQLGASLVAAEDREPGDLPLKWEGVVIAAVRPAPLHGALDRLIESVEREMGAPLPSLSRLLDDRGAFILRRDGRQRSRRPFVVCWMIAARDSSCARGARPVEDVADIACRRRCDGAVSRITVYNYLNALHR
jgi:hypothetical protein